VTRVRSERGQTANEYLMIAGLMTAMLIVLTSIIVPTMKTVGVKVVEHMVLHLSSPPRDEEAPPAPCPEFVEPEPGVECQ
jgi:Flp pilus assembly pilin Flp